MLSYCTDYLATVPEITVYINCDTRLAINLRLFDLGENDEFIFAIKNYNHIESPYVFLHRVRKSDIDETTGEVIFKIPPEVSKQLKPGAFYNFALLINAFDVYKPTEYKKLTGNGVIRLEYGAQDIRVKTETTNMVDEYMNITLEQLDDSAELTNLSSIVTDIHLEQID